MADDWNGLPKYYFEDAGVSLHTASDRVPLPRFERDEIARLFD